MSDFDSLAGNPVDRTGLEGFTAILGANPSKGARSPTLWNAAFAMQGLNARMLPIDVTEENLTPLLQVLDNDARFLGGAIAAPYKELVAQWLGKRLTSEAAAIGAVNCLYRNEEGRLSGTNTDGEGALLSYVQTQGKIAGKRVLLLGVGGAGKAVAAFFAAAAGGGQLTVAGRSPSSKAYAARIGADWSEWNALAEQLPAADIVVNCTSMGWGSQVAQSPLDAAAIARLPRHAVVFDIIYQPRPTVLLQLAAARGLQTLDGLAMNLEQAVLAYGHAVSKGQDAAVIRAAMQAAARNL